MQKLFENTFRIILVILLLTPEIFAQNYTNGTLNNTNVTEYKPLESPNQEILDTPIKRKPRYWGWYFALLPLIILGIWALWFAFYDILP